MNSYESEQKAKRQRLLAAAEMPEEGGIYLPRNPLDGSPIYAGNGRPVTFTFPGGDSPQFLDAVAEIAARKQARLPVSRPHRLLRKFLRVTSRWLIPRGMR